MKPKPKFKNEQTVWLLNISSERIYKVEIVIHQLINRNEFEYVVRFIDRPGCDVLLTHERTLFRTRRGALNKSKEIHEVVKEIIKEDG